MATRHRSAVKAHRQTLKRTAHNRALRAKLPGDIVGVFVLPPSLAELQFTEPMAAEER